MISWCSESNQSFVTLLSPNMRIDCHTHTACHSACASLKPRELVELAQLRSIDGLVITEHRHQWTKEDMAPLRSLYPDMALYAGVEITLAEGYDVVVISPGLPESIMAYPFIDALMDAMEPMREDVFLFVAHPFRYTNDLTPNLARILEKVDGIEMNSMNLLRGGAQLTDQGYQPQNSRCYAEARKRFDLIPIWNTDAHHPPSVGAIATEFPNAEPWADEAELAHYLKTTPGKPYQSSLLIEQFLAE